MAGACNQDLAPREIDYTGPQTQPVRAFLNQFDGILKSCITLLRGFVVGSHESWISPTVAIDAAMVRLWAFTQQEIHPSSFA